VKPRFNKYGAKKTTCRQVHLHDSKREARRCDVLTHMELSGEITDLETQPQFWFAINGAELKHDNGRRVGYQADFQYLKNGQAIVEDSKGFAARDFALRKAVFKALYPDKKLVVL
jgi:hypothetical protein